MAYAGSLDRPRRDRRRVPLLARAARAADAGSSGSAVANSFLPFIAASFGWVLTEIGRQPWIVQGLLLTKNANSPSVSTTWLGISLGVFVSLYVLLLVVDIWLMRRYAGHRPDGRAGAGRGRDAVRDAGAGVLAVDLQILWFLLVGFFWAGYFLLEGFDFGVGMLLPFLPRNEGERRDDVRARSGRSGTGTRSGSSSPAARRSPRSRTGTRRCSPASTSRCCSSSSS